MNHSASYILPKGWEMTLSSDYCESIADGTHDTPSPVAHNGVPLYTSKNLTDRNELLIDDAYLISLEDSIEINKRSYVNRHDILFGMIGTVGNPVIIQIEENDFSVKNVCIFRFGGDVTKSKWLYYFLKSDYFDFQINRLLDGSTQKFVPLSTLRNLKVPVPINIRQQQKIAKILTTVDNLIEKTQALIDKYTAIKQGMMADLFTCGIDLGGTPDTNPCHGQLRPPYEQAPELYKETELGWVPKEWEVYTFGDLADYKNGSSFSADDWKEEGLPIIRIQNLNGSGEYNYYQGEVKESWHVLSGDLLFAWSGQKGVSFGARLWSRHEGVLNQHIFKVYENKKLLSRKFLYYLFKINVGRIEDNAHGFKDSFVHVTRSELTDVAIMLPTLCEQKIIEGRVLALDNSLSIEKRSLKKFGKLKKGLMQDLLTGKVQVDE
jgi:type I restriction enzyme S subunit